MTWLILYVIVAASLFAGTLEYTTENRYKKIPYGRIIFLSLIWPLLALPSMVSDMQQTVINYNKEDDQK